MYGIGLYSLERLEKEATRVKADMEKVKADKGDLEKRLTEAQQQQLDTRRIEETLELMASNIENASYDDKRLAFEFLNLKVWVDSDSIAIDGVLPVLDGEIVSQPS